MINRKRVYSLLAISLIALVTIAIKFNYFERIFDFITGLDNENSIADSRENRLEEYPEHISETFQDKDGNDVLVEMARKTGTIDGEEIIFYEDMTGSEVIYCHFYKGSIKSVDEEKIIFIVKEEYKNADLDESYYEYEDVEDYEIKFHFEDYQLENEEEYGIRDMITINTEEIESFKDLEKYIGKNIKASESKFKDSIFKIMNKGLDFYVK